MEDAGASNASGGGSKFVVMIAMDGSEHSYHAFDWYMNTMHKPGTEIIVAHCPDYKHFMKTSVMTTDATVVSKMVQQCEEDVNQIITQIQSKLAGAKVDAKLLRLTGEPGAAIVKAADEYKVNCIVTGSRGFGALKRTLIGSVSGFILHHAHCPVLICPRKHDGKSTGQ